MLLKERGFAALFVWILYSTMKTNKERESNYQTVIEKN
ncbi:BhlA/UviB family holin-like peptide [Peribacillus sp. SI8-4]|nr:BhlA/UviB family holin-like peptide [Peribacillus sp. SI8-4]